MPTRRYNMSPARCLALFLALLAVAETKADVETVPVPPFSAQTDIGSPDSAWEPLTFPNIDNRTVYSFKKEGDIRVVQAETDNSASGLITRVQLDPTEYPVLSWRWKISNVYESGDARSKEGDDYPARVYVAFAFEPDKASFFERMKRKAASALFGAELPGRSLNYIWANKLAVGEIVPNPYSDATRMIAVNSGNAQAGSWVRVERNILADYREAFGEEPPGIVGIGIMSDSDSTGEAATAWYGDIALSNRPRGNNDLGHEAQ